MRAWERAGRKDVGDQDFTLWQRKYPSVTYQRYKVVTLIMAVVQRPPIFALGKLMMFVEDELGWSPDRAVELVSGSSDKTTELHRSIERIVAEHEAELGDGEMPRTWAALADQCGYYDQSHLINEFRSFSGLSPVALVRQTRPDPQSVVIR